MDKQYVEQSDQGYRITGSRVSGFPSSWHSWTDTPRRRSRQSVFLCSPRTGLRRDHHYLANRRQIDAYLQQQDAEDEAFHWTVRTRDSRESWPRLAANCSWRRNESSVSS